MSLRRSVRRWKYRHSVGALGLPVRPARRGDGPIGPVTSITPPTPTKNSSERTGAHVGIRLSVTIFVVVSLFSVLLVRLWSLQLVEGPQLNSVARSEIYQSVDVPAPRGEILTRDGMVLAGDFSKWQVMLARGEQTEHPQVISRLASYLGTTTKAIDDALASNTNSRYAPIPLPPTVAQVTQAEVLYIEQNPEVFPGVTVTQSSERSYPQSGLASQEVGYVQQITAPEYQALQSKGYGVADLVGQTGFEAQYESYLRGTPGTDKYEVDRLGVPLAEVHTTAPQAGDSLVLNMDGALESTLTTALSKQITALRYGSAPVPAPWGAAVVLNADTGAVLAMVSYPGYNDNLWVPYMSDKAYASLNPPGCASGNPNVGCPLLNYAVAGLQPPGSTFKLATATAALDDGLINAYSSYDDTGTFTVGNPPESFHDSDNEALGEVNVTSALSKSSDVFFYNLGWQFFLDQARFGKTPIQNVAHLYGLGSSSAIDLPGADIGQIDSQALRLAQHAEAPKAFPNTTYFGGDNIEMAFGQGETLVTPLELAEAYGTFANGGTRYAPEMAAAIVDPISGKVVKTIAPKVEAKVSLPASTRAPMLAGFEGAVQQSTGTAYAAFQGFNFSNFNVAGKTGTATTCLNDVSCQPTSWFVSFGGPSSQKPKYVVAVEIDQGGFGASASAPVARQVFNYLEKHPVGGVQLPKGQ